MASKKKRLRKKNRRKVTKKYIKKNKIQYGGDSQPGRSIIERIKTDNFSEDDRSEIKTAYQFVLHQYGLKFKTFGKDLKTKIETAIKGDKLDESKLKKELKEYFEGFFSGEISKYDDLEKEFVGLFQDEKKCDELGYKDLNLTRIESKAASNPIQEIKKKLRDQINQIFEDTKKKVFQRKIMEVFINDLIEEYKKEYHKIFNCYPDVGHLFTKDGLEFINPITFTSKKEVQVLTDKRRTPLIN